MNGLASLGSVMGGTQNPILGSGGQVATQLVITTQPASTSNSGAVLTTQPIVEIRDASNAKVSSATTAVTVAITSGTGTLSGTLTVSAVAGVATFTDLVITGEDTYVLTFTASGLTSAVSNSFVRDSFVAWKAQRALAGSQRVNMVAIGDSNTEGAAIASYFNSYAFMTGGRLQTRYGGGGINGIYPAQGQTRNSFGTLAGTWVSPVTGPGKRAKRSNSGTDTITNSACTGDTIMIGYNVESGSGDFKFNVDGGADIVVTCPTLVGAPYGVVYQQSGFGAGAHTIVVNGSHVGGAYCEIWGIGMATGATGIQYHEFGFSGQKVDYFVGASSMVWLGGLAPALVTINLLTNDYHAQTALATFKSETETLIQAAQAAGASVLLINPTYQSVSFAIPQTSYFQQYKDLAAQYNCAVLDHGGYLGNAANAFAVVATALADGINESYLGHENLTCLLTGMLTPLLPGTLLDEYGINFRGTPGYVTDGATDFAPVYGPGTNGYALFPEYAYNVNTSQFVGNRTGWIVNTGFGIAGADRSNSIDHRLAGRTGVVNGAVGDIKKFFMELSGPGNYEVTFAGGDNNGASTVYCRVMDDSTVRTTISGSTGSAAHFIDTTSVVRTSAADWASNNAKATIAVANTALTTSGLTFHGTFLTFDFTNIIGASGNTLWTHLHVKKV